MDSSDPQTTNSIRSPLSSIAYNSSMITASKRDVFLSTYCRQKFTFPGSMMHYIAKNPKNSKGYQKMVKSCKYFFVKNPILILSDLRYTQNGWKTYDNKTWKSIDIDRISCKLWITDKHEVVPTNDSNNYIASSIIAKIYQCDFKYLFLSNQFISLHELIFLCSSVEALHFSIVNVKNDDGTVVSFDKLIEQLPNVKKVI
uniref:Uncharacterized protein n=1 Tax=Panagrolaimus superbus TaxID=310955 RepID=A0A914Z1C4_9BILA